MCLAWRLSETLLLFVVGWVITLLLFVVEGWVIKGVASVIFTHTAISGGLEGCCLGGGRAHVYLRDHHSLFKIEL